MLYNNIDMAARGVHHCNSNMRVSRVWMNCYQSLLFIQCNVVHLVCAIPSEQCQDENQSKRYIFRFRLRDVRLKGKRMESWVSMQYMSIDNGSVVIDVPHFRQSTIHYPVSPFISISSFFFPLEAKKKSQCVKSLISC